MKDDSFRRFRGPFRMKFENNVKHFISHLNSLAYAKKSNIYDAGCKSYSIIKHLFLLPVNLIYRLVQHTIIKIIQKFCS
jgi:hypothetical protein